MPASSSDTGKQMDAFLEEWGIQLGKAKSILAYLGTYPDVLALAELEGIMDPVDMDASQEDWVRLCSKFGHPLEKDFFKPYWVPVVKDSYDYFMDLSDELFPVFESHYFFFEPYRWYKKDITSDISQIMLMTDRGVDLAAIMEENDQKRWREISGFFEERLQMGFRGERETKPVTLEDIFRDAMDDSPDDADSGFEHIVNYSTNGFEIVVPGVTSLVVGLFPFTLPVKLDRIEYLHGEPYTELYNVRTIRDLVCLIRHAGSLRVSGYSARFTDYPGEYLRFDGAEFKFSFSDSKVADGFIRELNGLKH